MNATAQIAECIRRAAGLDPGCLGQAVFDRAVQETFRRSRAATLHEYRLLLEHSDDARAELIEALLISETWFFRGRDAFAALRDWVLHEWLPDYARPPLRVLCAACSTGEEPYSVAMTLLDAGLPAGAFAIDALDISVKAIARARRAAYQKNSFREKNLDFRERYFRTIEGEDVLQPAVRRAVNFGNVNLAPFGVPAPANHYHVLFCRNLLIYFDAPTQRRVIESCERCLRPGGLLFLGPAETSLVSEPQFISLNHARAFAFRKQTSAEIVKRSARTRLADEALSPAHPRPIEGVTSRKASPKAAAPARGTKPQPAAKVELRKIPNRATSLRSREREEAAAEQGLLEIQRLADQGKLPAAATLCRTFLRERRDSAPAYFWLGMIHDAAGQIEQARECYRKAVYLQPEHAEALWHLALLSEKHGPAGEARHWRRRAERNKQRSGR